MISRTFLSLASQISNTHRRTNAFGVSGRRTEQMFHTAKDVHIRDLRGGTLSTHGQANSDDRCKVVVARRKALIFFSHNDYQDDQPMSDCYTRSKSQKSAKLPKQSGAASEGMQTRVFEVHLRRSPAFVGITTTLKQICARSSRPDRAACGWDGLTGRSDEAMQIIKRRLGGGRLAEYCRGS